MTAESRPSLSVIIVSYNTRQMTLECLRALYVALGTIDAELWVVDNRSNDGSAAAVRTAFPAVHVIANDENTGFGRANNQAMSQASGKYLLLLNSDAFAEPGAVQSMFEYIESHPRIAAVGPVLLNADQSIQESIFSFPSLELVVKNRLWANKLRRLFGRPNDKRAGDAHLPAGQYLSGACLLVRRSCYDDLGGFDESFFFYGEDADWQKRMRDAGWELAQSTDARVVHLRGGSGESDRLRYTLCYFDSDERFVRKYSGQRAALLVRAVTVIHSIVHLTRHLYRIPARWLNGRTEDFPARLAWRLLLQQFSVC